jgi:uncharacterized protein (TIGR03437 family)
VGIYQVNARLAQNTPPGLFIPVVIRIGPEGAQSNAVTIAVQ